MSENLDYQEAARLLAMLRDSRYHVMGIPVFIWSDDDRKGFHVKYYPGWFSRRSLTFPEDPDRWMFVQGPLVPEFKKMMHCKERWKDAKRA